MRKATPRESFEKGGRRAGTGAGGWWAADASATALWLRRKAIAKKERSERAEQRRARSHSDRERVWGAKAAAKRREARGRACSFDAVKSNETKQKGEDKHVRVRGCKGEKQGCWLVEDDDKEREREQRVM